MEQGSPTILIQIEKEKKTLFVDAGLNVSILQPGVSRSDIRVTAINPYEVMGQTLGIRDNNLFLSF
jgi:hypothetical protein